jgi:hypothetical protein
MMGAMLFLIANGSGPMSVASLLSRRVKAPAEEWARPVQATS